MSSPASAPLGPRAFVLLALAMGCELTAELGAYTGVGDETTAALDSETNNGASETGDEGGTGLGEAETTEGDGDGNGLCKIDGSEDPCRVCVEYLCCEHLENCGLESGCNCMVECLVESDPVTCAMTCTPGPAYFQLLQCQKTSCAAVCE